MGVALQCFLGNWRFHINKSVLELYSACSQVGGLSHLHSKTLPFEICFDAVKLCPIIGNHVNLFILDIVNAFCVLT